MQAVLLIGLQGAGKSTFYQRQFSATHLRLNLDMLKTRHRERRLMQVCLETQMPFVIDNTNPTRVEREVYISAAKAAGFEVCGYYFQSRVADCDVRNQQRALSQQVPLKGLLGTAGRLERPAREEGFDQLYYVRIDPSGEFVIEDWNDEV